MKTRLAVLGLFLLSQTVLFSGTTPGETAVPKKVYVVPIRDDIMPPLLYLVRRSVKEAMEAKAEVLVLDMETNGGRVDTTEELIAILNRFPGQTITYVNRKAFSAGAFIAFATRKIYMSPQSVIGAAAPVLMAPGGGGVEVSETMEAKMTSGIRALVRTSAEKNGYNIQVVEAMIDKTKTVEIDGEVLNKEGEILTLTNVQAEKEYGDPPKRLLSSGTVENVEALIADLGFAESEKVYVEPTGVERLGSWINKLSPVLLLIGIVGIYIEFKTPGFGIPGIVGLSAFAIYFLGGYVAGLSGVEWLALFALGLLLFVLELFFFAGTLFLGLAGAALMIISILMAMVDIYPSAPGLPAAMRFEVPILDMAIDFSIVIGGAILIAWVLNKYLPKTSLYGLLISSSASGEASVRRHEKELSVQLGAQGETVSDLFPGGKAQFGSRILDVVTHGEQIPRNRTVKIVGFSTGQPVVEEVNSH